MEPTRDRSALASQPPCLMTATPCGTRRRAGSTCATGRALMQSPLIQWQGNADAAKLQRDEVSGQWQVLNQQGQSIAQADMLVAWRWARPAQHCCKPVASMGGGSCKPYAGKSAWPTIRRRRRQPCRLFRSTARQSGAGLPGGDTPASPHQWIMGSTFERDVTELPPQPCGPAGCTCRQWEKLAAPAARMPAGATILF